MGAMVKKTSFSVAAAGDVIAGKLADAHIGLYKAPGVALNQNTVKADITALIANYDGYAEANIDWSTASISDDGYVEVVGTVPEFRPTGSNVDNEIVGAFITANSDDALLMFGEFDDSFLMNSNLDAAVVMVRYRPDTDTLLIAVS